MSRIGRDLLIKRDEVLLDEMKMRKAYAAGLGKEWDVFICHASEDKESLVGPLARLLRESGLTVWYDEFTLKIGDSLRRKIDEGLANSRYGIVVLSKHFFTKNWPQQELDGLVSRELAASGTKVILPVWHNITVEQVRQHSPMLSGRVAANSADGIETVVKQLREAMGLEAQGPSKPLSIARYLAERPEFVRKELGKVPQPWQRALLHELLVRGRMDEAHASGFLGQNGFGQLTGTLNALAYHTNLVTKDSVGYYAVNPDLREILASVLDEQQA